MVSINKYINPGEHRLIWTGNVNARVYRASYIAFSFIVDMKCGTQLTIIGGHAVGLSLTHTHSPYSTNVHVLHNLMPFSIEPVPCDDSSSSRLTPDWSHSASLPQIVPVHVHAQISAISHLFSAVVYQKIWMEKSLRIHRSDLIASHIIDTLFVISVKIWYSIESIWIEVELNTLKFQLIHLHFNSCRWLNVFSQVSRILFDETETWYTSATQTITIVRWSDELPLFSFRLPMQTEIKARL